MRGVDTWGAKLDRCGGSALRPLQLGARLPQELQNDRYRTKRLIGPTGSVVSICLTARGDIPPPL